MKTLVHAAAFLSTCAAAFGQDSLAVAFNGDVYHVDTSIPRATRIGFTGIPGENALARDGNNVFWTISGTATAFRLTRIDPFTGVATQTHPIPDIRALSAASGTDLYGIEDNLTLPDFLVRIDTVTGTVVRIGLTGFTGVQGLATRQGALYGWDITAGLLQIDPLTGVATDVNPLVGVPASLQSLSYHPGDLLLAGGGASNQLYSVDRVTGSAVLLGSISGAANIRGIEPFGGFTSSLGTACSGTFGPATMTVTGMLTSNGSFTTTSRNHAPQVLGMQILGFSTVASGTIALPLLLDPILGTANCSLYVSPDVTTTGLTAATSPAMLTFQVPLSLAAMGLTVYAQHACFEPLVAGGLSMSNSAEIHIAP